MIRKAAMIVAWAVATVAATGIAVTAVGNVADQVVDTPAAAEGVSALASGSSSSQATSSSGATTSTRGRQTTTTRGRQTTTSNGGTATSTSNGGSVTSSTNGGTTSTTEQPPPVPTETATYNLVGGWVQIAYGPGIVELVGAAPNSGFSIEIKESGPDRVEVEFESDNHESKFRADETTGGTPEIRIEEDD